MKVFLALLILAASASAQIVQPGGGGGGGTGTVTSVIGSSPVTSDGSTTTPTIACPTCGVTGSPLSQFAATTSAQFFSVISDETGSGAVVGSTSPTLVTPTLGVASATSLSTTAGNLNVNSTAQLCINSDTCLARNVGGKFQISTNSSTANASGSLTGVNITATGVSDGEAPTTVTTGTTATLGGTNVSGFTINQQATPATAVSYTLPTSAAGKQYCVENGWNGTAPTTGVITLNTSATGQFIIFSDGTLSATGGNVTSGGAAADMACVHGIDSTHWQISIIRGSWVKH